MSQPPKNRPPVRSVTQAGNVPPPPPNNIPTRSSGAPPRPTGSSNRPRSVPQRRNDPFPFVIGGVVGALVVGIMVLVFILVGRNTGTTTSASNPLPATTIAGVAPTVGTDATAGPTSQPPPRMALEDFKKLYDAPTKPLIIDVRPKTAFDAGHIRGAISFPESDVDTRIGELPKDKLIVAYCQ